MKNIFLCVCLMCFILGLSCCSKPVQQVSRLTEIRIDPDKVEGSIDISPMLDDSVDIIPLETTDECLLSNIERLTFYKGNYYILDGSRRGIFVFDGAGRFVRKIGKQGNGPGEYSSVLFFDFMGDSILIQDHHRLNCVIYSLATGKAVKEFTHIVEVHDGFCLKDQIFFYTSYRKVDNENFNLCRLDLFTGKVVEKFIPFDEKLAKFSTTGIMNDISKYRDSVYVIYPYNDTIYQVTKEGAAPLYNIHFTSRNLPDDIEPVNGSFIYAVSKGEYVKGFTHIQVSKDYIWGMYPDKGRFRFVNVNRRTLETKLTDCFVVDKLGHLSLGIPYIADGDLISVQSTSFLSDVLKSALSEYAPTEAKYRGRLKELQKNLKDDSNPVLFRYRLKEVD